MVLLVNERTGERTAVEGFFHCCEAWGYGVPVVLYPRAKKVPLVLNPIETSTVALDYLVCEVHEPWRIEYADRLCGC